MKFFYLSTVENSDGFFEIHERDCPSIPGAYDRQYLGPFNSESEAFRLAMKTEPSISLCQECCRAENDPIIAMINSR
jgi:hypothetical protein